MAPITCIALVQLVIVATSSFDIHWLQIQENLGDGIYHYCQVYWKRIRNGVFGEV